MTRLRTNGGERRHRVTVQPIPHWLPTGPLLAFPDAVIEACGPGQVRAVLDLTRVQAADLAARLRGLGFGGHALEVRVEPGLPRGVIRAARTVDARRRREGTPGFHKPGVRLDSEARMSLTPETLAVGMAGAVAAGTVVDACCGGGGNAIAFARIGWRVTAIEMDARRLALAQHNARQYGVANRIRFVHGDAVQVLQRCEADLLFIDPPWGADWSRIATGMADLPLLQRLWPQTLRFPCVWIKVPPSFDPGQLPTPGVFSARGVFGTGPGDQHRVKFLWLRSDGPGRASCQPGLAAKTSEKKTS